MNKFFVIAGLIMLTACSNNKRSANATQTQNTTAENSESLQQKQAEGIDLFAKGKTPASWTLEIDFDKAIRFKSLDGTNIIASSTKPTEIAEEKRTSIITSTEFGKMQIDIYRQDCVDELSNEKFDKKVTVQVNGKTYEGCGTFLSDANIIGKWTLQQWNGKKLSSGSFAKGLPQIQFDVAGNRVTGHDGCNQFFGPMEIRGNFIMLSGLSSTKMACPGNDATVQLTSKINNQVVSYFFKDGLLHLYLPDDSIAIFSK